MSSLFESLKNDVSYRSSFLGSLDFEALVKLVGHEYSHFLYHTASYTVALFNRIAVYTVTFIGLYNRIYGMNTAKTPMTKEQAYKELAKVGVILGALENGAISLMSDKQVEQVLEWLN